VAPPLAASKATRNSKTANTHELLQILDEAVDFPKQPVTVAHRFAALVVAGMMLLLPVIYVLFAVGVGWLTFWHATHDYVWVRSPLPTGARFIVMSGLLYLGLTVGGVLWTFSLIRPLFLRLGGSDGQLGLSRHDEPLLFAFTDLLADKVGAPRPQIIRLSFESNASASYDTSMLGLKRRAFTLTLGLPLIRGLTLAELAGVMAHEFGHFSQRSSSFLHRFITRINLWFVVAVHHPGAIDAMIESLTTTDGNSYLLNLAALVGWVLGMLVRLGRSVLWCLMQLGILASASLSRRMEFDADCYHVGVIGSAAYPKACRRFMALVVAHEMALKYTFQSLQGRIIPADLSSFVVELADRSPQVKKRARKMIEKQKSDWMASHPPMRERIAAAKQLNLPGAFTSPIPAQSCSALSRSRARLSRAFSTGISMDRPFRWTLFDRRTRRWISISISPNPTAVGC
jgi:Zn-dependent protease with chaperone function